MTWPQPWVDGWMVSCSMYVDEHPEFGYVEFAMDAAPDLCAALQVALEAKYPDRTFHVGDPSPAALRAMDASGMFDDDDDDVAPDGTLH